MDRQLKKPRAVLVSVQMDQVDDETHAASLRELGRLVQTLGFEVVGEVSQKRGSVGTTVLGAGKLAELAAMTGGSGVVGSLAKGTPSKARQRFAAGEEDEQPPQPLNSKIAPQIDFVIVDHEISPRQARNLERATGVPVLDRTGVIVEIFHRHANSREARLQVEMARLKYVAPRARETQGGGGRQQGVGAGESDIELDRRKIRDRLAELRKSLETVQRDQEHRRTVRRDELRVALVGYTNAGKSSLMKALTGSDILVADKLFATLDTTVRALQPETKPRILVCDTVGFIKQLPHDLVASFRSTLAEALESSLLLYVVDASDPTYEAQLEVSRAVLHEIGADVVPSRLILNKIDAVPEEERARLHERHPDAIAISARSAEDVAALRETIIGFFETEMVDDAFFVPYAKDALLGGIYDSVRVVSQDYDADGRTMHVRGLPASIARLRKSLVAANS